MWEQGYTVLENVASPEFLRELRAQAMATDPGGLHVLPKHAVFAQAALNEKLMAIAEFSVGGRIHLEQHGYVPETERRSGPRNTRRPDLDAGPPFRSTTSC